MSQKMTNVLHGIWKNEAFEGHPLSESLALFYERIPTWESGLDKISSYSIDDLLRRASTVHDLDWLVVHGEGTLYHSQNRILEVVNEFIATLDESILVAGHLINKANEYCGLHEQFMIINVKAWDRLGQPYFGDYGRFQLKLQNYKAGPSIHDDYTPEYLVPQDGESLRSVWVCGWNLINTAMKNGMRVVNIPQSIRDEKVYLYPRDESARLLKNIELVQELMPTQNISQNRAITYLMLKKLGISDYAWPNGMANYSQRSMAVFAYNTEILIPDPDWIRLRGGELSAFIGTCAGFLDAANLKHFGFNEETKLIYYDVNPHSVMFKEHLLSNFDGDLEMFPHFLNEFKQRHPDIIISDNNEQQGLSELRKEFASNEEFKQIWTRMRKLNRKFIQCNLLDDRSALFKCGLDAKKRTLMCISDIFTGTNELTYGTHNLRRVYVEMLESFRSWDQMIIQGTDYKFMPVLDYAHNLRAKY